MLEPFAQFQSPNVEDFFAEPVLTIACILLISTSIAWIVVSRLVAYNLRKAAKKGLRSPNVAVVREPRDIWTAPPQ